MTHPYSPTSDDFAWCDIKAAAKHLGMSVAFLRKAVRLKHIPFARAGTKALRFRRADLDHWLEANGCTGKITAQIHKGH